VRPCYYDPVIPKAPSRKKIACFCLCCRPIERFSLQQGFGNSKGASLRASPNQGVEARGARPSKGNEETPTKTVSEPFLKENTNYPKHTTTLKKLFVGGGGAGGRWGGGGGAAKANQIFGNLKATEEKKKQVFSESRAGPFAGWDLFPKKNKNRGNKGNTKKKKGVLTPRNGQKGHMGEYTNRTTSRKSRFKSTTMSGREWAPLGGPRVLPKPKKTAGKEGGLGKKKQLFKEQIGFDPTSTMPLYWELRRARRGKQQPHVQVRVHH